MAYEKQTWVDGVTPIDAEHLNHIEEGIGGCVQGEELDAAVQSALAQAKESGEFDGADGQAGKDGSDGVGIKSVEQTTTSTADGGSNIITVTKTDGTTSTVTVRNGSKGSAGDVGAQGERGEVGINWRGEWDGSETYAYRDAVRFNGSAYIYIDELGQAPEGSVPDTDTEVWELLVSKGAAGAAGSDGQAGTDGVSVTHSWSGTTLTVTSASGTSSANLKGEKGDTGADGKTPVKGNDYFTAADVAAIAEQVKSNLTFETWTFILSDGSAVSKEVCVS